ncbi:urea ABC transporter permease subunit UrtB [Sneathiella litorea]|uniref:Urea ABC transporter permease subunit UrtB n=1 Tax=Sneathiella litorea TaxID=2606216 RepID=A0A6L8W4U0_9PROT|nr:urea ABC transporter permease subunit UrtB [Sneathiella litorea]MZR30068.1 urea ABC transporter permease subunit UrtB [Sneathiella litorea]
MEALVIQTLNGVSLASILILTSLGLAVIFGMLGVVNLAHGELFMLGAYAVATMSKLGLSPWWGLLVAPIVVGAIGMLIERTIIRRLYHRPIDTLLATWGVSIVIRQVVRLIYGTGHMSSTSLMVGSTTVFGYEYPTYRLFVILVTVLVVLLTFFLYFKTTFGLKIRLVISNRSMARALGINTSKTDMWAFGIASALGGLAGAIMSPLVTIDPEMGLAFLAKGFIVVIVGGIGSLYGVIAGGAVIGGGEAAISFLLRPVVAQIIIVLLAVVIIRVRPKGITG